MDFEDQDERRARCRIGFFKICDHRQQNQMPSPVEEMLKTLHSLLGQAEFDKAAAVLQQLR